ncbi:MAG: hypothetical protein EXS21_08250 [Pedosphaera sp.]|nr:hypothetical protein [Pedosphaera sp.]
MSNLNGQHSTFTVLVILAYLVLAATDAASTLPGMVLVSLNRWRAGGISRDSVDHLVDVTNRLGMDSPRSSKDIVLTIKHCCCLNHLGFPQPQR